MASSSSFYTIINDVYDAANHALKMVISMVHTHTAATGQGGQLDWDNVWSDAVHTHASDAEGGTLDHGTALTGLTDDDHTQYQKESLLTTQGDMIYATAASTWERLPKGTANQIVRMNAGATAPEWVSAGIVFTELAGADNKTATGASGWEDWDISAVCPANSTYALISIGTDNGLATGIGGVRANGSALNRYSYLPTGTTANGVNAWGVTMTVALDANRIVEIYASSTTNVHFNVLGYWT